MKLLIIVLLLKSTRDKHSGQNSVCFSHNNQCQSLSACTGKKSEPFFSPTLSLFQKISASEVFHWYTVDDFLWGLAWQMIQNLAYTQNDVAWHYTAFWVFGFPCKWWLNDFNATTSSVYKLYRNQFQPHQWFQMPLNSTKSHQIIHKYV